MPGYDAATGECYGSILHVCRLKSWPSASLLELNWACERKFTVSFVHQFPDHRGSTKRIQAWERQLADYEPSSGKCIHLATLETHFYSNNSSGLIRMDQDDIQFIRETLLQFNVHLRAIPLLDNIIVKCTIRSRLLQ